MALAKFLLILVTLTAQQYGITSPNVRPPTEELREQRGVERVLPYFITFVKIMVGLWAFLEGIVTLAPSGYCPPGLARPVLDTIFPFPIPDSSLAHSTMLTPSLLVGALLSLAGTLLRAHCFRALGASFTFELSIRPAHALVTDGVYGIVRHPSYTGAIALAYGYTFCLLDPRGIVMAVSVAWIQAFIAACGWSVSRDATLTGILVYLWTTSFVRIFGGASKRIKREDAMLEKHFGEEWRTWAKRVPCRLVPGVY